MNIELLVKNGLCTGCGVCISEDISKTSKMIWNEEGFLVPKVTQISSQERMVRVCPFNPNQINEDTLGEIFLKNQKSLHNLKIGFYHSLYVGYSKEYRKTSSSGGMATYIFNYLLKNKIVDYLFVVNEKDGSYEYQIISDSCDIKKISKTRYIPVTLEKLFDELNKIEGKIAVSAVACFVKALRLKQHYSPELKQKIKFIVGIICGGLKSRYYTDYLAQSAGCFTEYELAQYRIKKEESYALDYKFSCQSKIDKKIYMVDMQQLGDMWGTGLFKSNACDFCDDVVTELADISLGDAWIEPYLKDGLGNSIIITRSILADKIVKNGRDSFDLFLENLSEEKIVQSQSGSFNHRHKGLYFRIQQANKYGKTIPSKRAQFIEKQNFFFNLVQLFRLETRKKSLNVWQETHNVVFFNKIMDHYLKKLVFYTKYNHRINRLKQLLKKLVNLS